MPVPLEVQTLLRQSDQAAKTIFLTIHGRSSDDILDMSMFNDEDWTLVEAALVRVSTSEEERAEWLRAIREGFWDALIALELTLLPNLEFIAFPEVFSHMDEQHKWYKTVLEKVAESQSGTDKSTFLLPQLQNVSLAHWDTENGMAIEELLVFMSVPSVQQLDAFMVSDGWEASPGMSSSVKDLTLAFSCIDSTALRDLIQCCPQLENFSYQAGGAIVGYSNLIPSVLSPALATLKPCLRALNIIDDDVDGMRDDWPEDGDPEAPMASFADFEKLHTLSLRACMLVGKDRYENNVESEFMELDLEDTGPKTSNLVDVVPKSLKNLSLSHCGSGILAQLEELLARKEEVTPVLDLIQIGNKENCAIDEVEAQRLADGFKERNVHLKILMCCASGCHSAICAKPKEIHANTTRGPTVAQQCETGFRPQMLNT